MKDYWEDVHKKWPLSKYLREWKESPDWVWKKAKEMEDRLAKHSNDEWKLIERLRELITEFDIMPREDRL